MSELVVREAGQLAPAQQSPLGLAATQINIGALLEKAVDVKSGVEALKELVALQDQLRRQQAKAEFDAAMAAFQAECPPITKEKTVSVNNQVMYRYAPIEAIEIQIRPVRERHGFSHRFDTDVESKDGWVIAKCVVTHRAGHSEASVCKFPLAERTRAMSPTQQYAATLTFANRRALMNAYGIVVIGEDIDGQTGKIPVAGPNKMEPSISAAASNADVLKALRTEAWKVLQPVRGELKNWDMANQWLWKHEILDGASDEACPNLSVEKWKHVIAESKRFLS